jgi:hypothetical protein
MLKKMRVIFGLGFLITCAMLSACGGGDTGEEKVAGSGKDREITRSAGNTTVLFHITGLALVVPENNEDSMHVVLPNEAGHVARFGFGRDPAKPDPHGLCVNDSELLPHIPKDMGICYVDLALWTMGPFGAGGQIAPPDSQLPAGLLNVSDLTGGYVVQLPVDPQTVRSSFAFSSGWAGANHCSLATWTFHQASSQKDSSSLPLVNVFDWVIRNPTDLNLTFRKKGTTTAVTETLLASPTGITEVLLAHIPSTDLPQLPPKNTGMGINNASDAHFDPFYDLVDKQGQKPGQNQRPRVRRPRGVRETSCAGRVTTGIGFRVEESGALGTYACIVGRADGG